MPGGRPKSSRTALCHPDRPHCAHDLCESCYRKKYRKATPRLVDKEKARLISFKSHLKRTYGISVEEYQRMLKNQNGLCLICYKPVAEFHLDHDHKTGRIRGLLCHKCNTLLGMCNDDIGILWSAVNYLMENETDPYKEAEQQDAQKLQQAYMIGRYRPEQGRADKLAANIPGHKGQY